MNYLVVQAIPGKTLEQNITAALAAFRLRFEGRGPSCVFVHPSQACQHPLIAVVVADKAPVVAKDTFWMPCS